MNRVAWFSGWCISVLGVDGLLDERLEGALPGMTEFALLLVAGAIGAVVFSAAWKALE